MVRVILASIGLGFVMPSPRHRIQLDHADDLVGRMQRTSEGLKRIKKATEIDISFRIYQGRPMSMLGFESRYNDSYSRVEGGFIVDHGPNIAEFTVAVYEELNARRMGIFKLPEPERIEQQNRLKKDIDNAVKAVSMVTLSTLTDAGFPDLFIGETGHRTEEVLGEIYSSIQAMGREIDGSSLVVCEPDKCRYPLSRRLEAIKKD
jgi:hypothetical protein